ncbi:MAG: methylenetetrahydrofolate--tRNA-(uracil(54)-C(5))-methyltransferase (FADH(2)-oxidizing) TrmFO [Nitrospirae bacterium]|nr:methylenetetrahydrofolate--tRNA-(uracil(54)-C(5))-methyltransferase (FADH(2)-oxidizing) TrmFO [Nitrospirota bacterium]
MKPEIVIIGGGLAGSEAAWQAAQRGVKVLLYEMRPGRMTEAHKTGDFAELVCSNSLKSKDITNAHGLLKEELRELGSLIIQAADKTSVPSGSALSVDRVEFSHFITDAISSHPNIKVLREEVSKLSFEVPLILATGPLTSQDLTEDLQKIIKHDFIYFYDAISPVISNDSINYEIAFRASRYNKGGADYINCPMDRKEYEQFFNALITADKVHAKDFEKIPYFEGCMPVEVLAERGIETLAYGPMKPVGLTDPRNGRQPHAVVQLRQEDRFGQAYNMVGFQTRLKWPEQKRVFRMIPGLEHAEFLRYGSQHRNTFINSPKLLDNSLRLKGENDIYVAGQITGVEGYVESTAMGLLAGISAVINLNGEEFIPPPVTTAAGALLGYITADTVLKFQPMNINWGLFPPLAVVMKDKEANRERLSRRALKDISKWKMQLKIF